MLDAERSYVVRCISQLHRMAFLRWKIDQDLVEKKIPLRHSAKTPAFVQTISTGSQLFQLVGLTRGQLCGFDKFLEFGIHRGRTNYGEASDSRAEIAPVMLLILILLMI